MKNLTVKNVKILNNVKYKNQPTQAPKRANSVSFSLEWNKTVVQSQYSRCFFELLQAALDFNDFVWRETGRERLLHIQTLPFCHSQVSECLAAFLPYNTCLAFET